MSWRWCSEDPKLVNKKRESDLKIMRQKINDYFDFLYKSGDYIQIHQVYSQPDFARGSFQSVQPSHCIIRLNPNNL